MSHLGGANKPVVAYYYNDDVGNYQYNVGHPMKPLRVRMTDHLIRAYELEKYMKAMDIEPEYIESVDFSLFHSDDYVDLLKTITPETKDLYADQMNRCKDH